jgi:DNA-binding NarL/FixJ family response regulator
LNTYERWKQASKKLDAAKAEEHEARIKLIAEIFLARRNLLSARERDVMDGARVGLTNKEMANKMNISERTIKFHMSNMLQKVGCRDRRELLRGIE